MPDGGGRRHGLNRRPHRRRFVAIAKIYDPLRSDTADNRARLNLQRKIQMRWMVSFLPEDWFAVSRQKA